jgi:hypothetical protein
LCKGLIRDGKLYHCEKDSQVMRDLL